jgi:hypothetical protein
MLKYEIISIFVVISIIRYFGGEIKFWRINEKCKVKNEK